MSFALSPHFREAHPLAQRATAAAGIGATYTLVGSLFGEGVITLFVISSLDEDIQISLDGTTDFMPILAGSAVSIDLKTNQVALGGWRGVYVKEIGDPTTGSLYVSAIGVE